KLSTEGVGRIVYDSTGLKKNSSPIVANREYAKAHPAVIRAYLKVVQRANEELRAKPGEYAKVISGIVGLKPEQTEHSLKTFDWDVHIAPEDQKEFERSAKFLLANG